jgi:hypothetical protein
MIISSCSRGCCWRAAIDRSSSAPASYRRAAEIAVSGRRFLQPRPLPAMGRPASRWRQPALVLGAVRSISVLSALHSGPGPLSLPVLVLDAQHALAAVATPSPSSARSLAKAGDRRRHRGPSCRLEPHITFNGGLPRSGGSGRHCQRWHSFRDLSMCCWGVTPSTSIRRSLDAAPPCARYSDRVVEARPA